MKRMNSSIRLLLSMAAVSLAACTSLPSLDETPAHGNHGGTDCFAAGATAENTREGSGVSLFHDVKLFPNNANTGTPWTFLSPAALAIKGKPNFSYQTCSAKYDAIVNAVVAQDRNKAGTENDGKHESYFSLKEAIATSKVPFVGLDSFYWAADNLGLSKQSTDLTEAAFKKALDDLCSSTVTGDNLKRTGVCPNGTFMHNFLWRADGLFSGNGNSRFVGVQPSKPVNGNPGLTWTRGYLLKQYSNQPASTPIYTAIFDAGSSGTRVSLYKVTPGSKAMIQVLGKAGFNYEDSGINDFMGENGWIDANVLPQQRLPKGCIRTTGLDQTQVGPCVLQPLLDYVTSQLPPDVDAAAVKVELFATAGMRTEDQRNGGTYTAGQISNFYDHIVKSYVRNTALANGAVYRQVGQFKTINGNSEEGVWTWINLNEVYYDTFAVPGSCGVNQVGNFEVGGSSMQVVFPTDAAAHDTTNVYNVNINGCSINVYSKTYLGLGGDDARKFMRAVQ